MLNVVDGSLTMHRILARTTLDYGLFFFVQGAVRANPEVSVHTAILDFCNAYEIPGAHATMKTKYYRMLDEFRGDAGGLKSDLKKGT